MRIRKLNESKELSNGVFWDIDGELLAFPYYDGYYTDGIAKSGDTYNHKKLWPDIKPNKCNKPYNYYPRGRVVVGNNKVTIYMNQNVDEKLLSEIKREFGIIDDNYRIVYDNSEHYKCYLDDGWKADK